ncbi:hypothetical protein, partial [Bacillus sp. SJS]|uniref:hypothetical protein n=1 Tax=Bacillus sp. SJS TaxID=1423321 RepID=UPI0004DD2BFB
MSEQSDAGDALWGVYRSMPLIYRTFARISDTKEGISLTQIEISDIQPRISATSLEISDIRKDIG